MTTQNAKSNAREGDGVADAMYGDLEATLRRRITDDGMHGSFPDELCAKAADAIANLRTALASQIEITNTERALAERLAAMQAQQGAEPVAWQPIETAPKDGRVVLFCDISGNRWTQVADCRVPVCGKPPAYWHELPAPATGAPR